MKVPEVLTHKLGPLPVGVWVLAIGGGLAVAVVVRKRADTTELVEVEDTGGEYTGESGFEQGGNTSTAPGTGSGYLDWYEAEPEAAEPDDVVTDPEDYYTAEPEASAPDPYTTGDAGMPAAPAYPGSTQAPAMDSIAKARAATTNTGWRSHSRAALVARGFRGQLVDKAYDDWWKGKDVNGAEGAVIAQAIALCGPPPSPPKVKADTGGNLPGGGGGGGGNGGNGGNGGGGAGNGGNGGGGGGGGNGGGGGGNDDGLNMHKWVPKGPVNRDCKQCGLKRNIARHTNRG